MLFSSGDNGDELAAIGTRPVDFPASDPWVTAVGGTGLAVGQGQQLRVRAGLGHRQVRRSPTARGTRRPPAYLYGAGGGTSQVFAQPWYQKGVVPASISNYFGAGPAPRRP